MKLPPLQRAGPVEVTALSPCGGYLFVSTAEQGWLFSLPDRRLRQTVKIAPLFDAVFKEDGMLALCGARTVTMVGLPHLQRRPSAKHVSGTGVPGAVWLPGDRLVTASLEPGRALMLDFMGNKLATLAAAGDMVFSVATDERYIAVYGDELTVWDDLTLTPVGTGRLHAWSPTQPFPMRFHHNGRRVSTPMPSVFAMAFTPGGHLVTAGADGNIGLWDPKTVQLLDSMLVPELDPRRLVFPLDEAGFLTSTTGLWRIGFDPPRADRLVPLPARRFRWNTPIGLAVSPDRSTLVFGGLVGEIGVWDLVGDRRVG